MIDYSFRVLEYEKIRDLLAGQTVTAPGRELALLLRPLADRQAVLDCLAEVSEMRRFHEEAGRPPLGESSDLRDLLQLIRAEGTWLTAEGLLAVAGCLQAAKNCRRFFHRPEVAPRLTEVGQGLVPLEPLAAELRESIGTRGEILDSASFELGELRREIRQVRARIKRLLEGLLHDESLAAAFQESLITERNDRYVLPVRADRRGLVQGFVHDESASGQTLFVEPAVTLDANNELRGLLREERREEERILLRLSAAVRQHAEVLLNNQRLLAHLDFLAAAARLSLAMEGCAPRISGDSGFELKRARHPLLLFDNTGQPANQAVAVDLRLDAGSRTLVISGPNTGGKTVALKTIGLLHLMVASGLHIPCHPDSRVHLYSRVLADIGDEQSIEAHLSTFSGHLTHIREILALADERSLVLLDEVGTGTDPAEGAALAMAVLDVLQEQGADTVATTHLNLVKSYAQLRQGVQNAAVEFDPQTLAPTYHLHYGIPGSSAAFTIARRLHLPEKVLDLAGSYLGDGEQAGLGVLEELNRLSRELKKDREAAARLRQEAAREREHRRQLLKDLEQTREKTLERARQEAARLVQDTEKRLHGLLKEASEGAGDTAEQARLTGAVRQVGKSLDVDPAPGRRRQAPREVKVGELVRFLPLNVEAQVTHAEEGRVELEVGGKKLRCTLEDLEAYRPRRFKAPGGKPARVRSQVTTGDFQPRLLLVGQRVDDALPKLERFLDDALLHHHPEVEVIHGTGEGILRRAVRELLARHRGVRSFHAADLAQGGDNVTVVELGG